MFKRPYFIIPLLVVAVIWAVFIAGRVYNLDLSYLGILPRSVDGIGGILASPFVHGSWEHLIVNTPPLLVSLVMLGYFYRNIALKTSLLIWLSSDILLWIFGREVYHIGASGVIYGYVSFILIGGLIRRNRRLAVVSLLLILFYGSMVWGVVPQGGNVSWEGHLFGGVSGILFAIIFRREGPLEDRIIFDDDAPETDEYEKFHHKHTPHQHHHRHGNHHHKN